VVGAQLLCERSLRLPVVCTGGRVVAIAPERQQGRTHAVIDRFPWGTILHGVGHQVTRESLVAASQQALGGARVTFSQVSIALKAPLLPPSRTLACSQATVFCAASGASSSTWN
jgi:hypothetical protein